MNTVFFAAEVPFKIGLTVCGNGDHVYNSVPSVSCFLISQEKKYVLMEVTEMCCLRKCFFVGICHLKCHCRLHNSHTPVGEASDSHSLKTVQHFGIINNNTYLLTYLLHGAGSFLRS